GAPDDGRRPAAARTEAAALHLRRLSGRAEPLPQLRELDPRRARTDYGVTRSPVAIAPSTGSWPCRSNARKLLNSLWSGPWKSDDPVVSIPCSAQRSTSRRACSASCVG